MYSFGKKLSLKSSFPEQMELTIGIWKSTLFFAWL